MLFEDFDKKIKEAADQHHPAYDEKAWQKMEKLLGQHLPQPKDDRRRLLFLLLLLLGLGGSVYFVVAKPGNKVSKAAVIADGGKVETPVGGNKSLSEKTAASSSVSSTIDRKQVDDKHGSTGDQTLVNASQQPETPGKSLSPAKTSRTKSTELPKNKDIFRIATGSSYRVVYNPKTGKKPIPVVTGSGARLKYRPNQKLKQTDSDVSSDSGNSREKQTKDAPVVATTTSPQLLLKNDGKSTTDPSADPKQNNNKTEIASAPDKTQDQTVSKADSKANPDTAAASNAPIQTHLKKKSGANNGLGFFVSAGPDASKAGSSKTGKTTLSYGGGISYTLNRFTASAGIFASKKLYWAGSNDYKLWFTPPTAERFIGANADCDVIDIPVELTYALTNGEKGHWFATGGLSTYLMKKEKYVYLYKMASTTYTYPYETKNESKHYFSVLTVSAGYTRRITNKISLSTAPYVEVPLTGIGIGRVHLNSGGVLFTVGIMPFRK